MGLQDGQITRQERFTEIDVAKGIGIVLVVLGHLENLTSSVWKNFAATFHMPLFFVVSGFLFKRDEPRWDKFLSFVKRKAVHIMVPYFIWALIYSLIDFTPKKLVYILYMNNRTFAEAGLWFLPTLFLSECLYYIIRIIAIKSYEWVEYALVIGCAILSFLLHQYPLLSFLESYGYPFSFDIALTAVVFICLGSLCREFVVRNYRRSESIKMKLLSAVGIIVGFLLIFAISRINYTFLDDYTLDRVVMARATYGLYPLFLIGGTAGSFLVLAASKYLCSIKWLAYIGKNSLLYMCLNNVFISAVLYAINAMNINLESINVGVSIMLTVVACIVVLALCSITSLVINRWIPILNGKTRKGASKA